MTEEVALPPQGMSAATLEQVVVTGDLSRLSPAQRLEYYRARCSAAGLDPTATPFQYIVLNGKLTLYASKSCTDQLARVHGIKLAIVNQATEGGVRVVQVRAETKDGRQTEEIGVVNVEGLKGDNLGNAMMKAVTKAKRRAILSMCGLGMLDEVETETIPGARTIQVDHATGEIVEAGDRPSPIPAREQAEIDAFATGSAPAPVRSRSILGIPILTTKTWEMVKTLPIGGKSKYAALTLGAMIDENADDGRVEFLESEVIRAIQDKWNRTVPAKKHLGVGLTSECALIAYNELMERRSPSPLMDTEETK